LQKLLPGFGGNFSIGLDLEPERLILVQMEQVAGRPSIRAHCIPAVSLSARRVAAKSATTEAGY